MSSSESSPKTRSADHGHRSDRGEDQPADQAGGGNSPPIQPPPNERPQAVVSADGISAGSRVRGGPDALATGPEDTQAPPEPNDPPATPAGETLPPSPTTPKLDLAAGSYPESATIPPGDTDQENSPERESGSSRSVAAATPGDGQHNQGRRDVGNRNTTPTTGPKTPRARRSSPKTPSTKKSTTKAPRAATVAAKRGEARGRSSSATPPSLPTGSGRSWRRSTATTARPSPA